MSTSPKHLFLAFWSSYDDSAYGENLPLGCVVRLDAVDVARLKASADQVEQGLASSVVLNFSGDHFRWIKKVGFLSENDVAPIDGFLTREDKLIASDSFLNAEMDAEADFMDTCEVYDHPVAGTGMKLSFIDGKVLVVPVGWVDVGRPDRGYTVPHNFCGIYASWGEIASEASDFFGEKDVVKGRVPDKWKEIAVLHHIDFVGEHDEPVKMYDELVLASDDPQAVQAVLDRFDAQIKERYQVDDVDAVARYVWNMGEMLTTNEAQPSPSVGGLDMDATDQATILAALTYYRENGMGEPANRSDHIHEIATGMDDSVISMDDAGLDDLIVRVRAIRPVDEAPVSPNAAAPAIQAPPRNPLLRPSFGVAGEDLAHAIADILIKASVPFAIEPECDDCWSFDTKKLPGLVRQQVEQEIARHASSAGDAAVDGARRYYETMVQVRVLSEDEPVGDMDLGMLNEAITSGDCVGRVTTTQVLSIDGPTAARRLIEMGSEPGFFRLDADGVHEDDIGDEHPRER